MPRVTDTRKARAAELQKRATSGPDFGLTFSTADLTDQQKQILERELRDRYRLWAESWLLPPIKSLVPELRQEATKEKQHNE